MKRLPLWLPVALVLLLAGCKGTASARPVVIFENGQAVTVETGGQSPAAALAEAGLSLGNTDRIFHLGQELHPDQAIPGNGTPVLVIRRAVELTVRPSSGEPYTLLSSADTIGQALADAGIELYAIDRIDPPPETPLSGGMQVTFQPSQPLTIAAAGRTVQVRSAAGSVGQALAEAGFPLTGLDYSLPPESASLPADGRLNLVRVQESVLLTHKILTYVERYEATADLELDQQAALQVGHDGLAVWRERVRFENGAQVATRNEGEIIIRPAQDEVIGYGTRIVIRTLETPDGVIEYWRTRYVYATAYSPCNSGVPGSCYYYTSTRKKVAKGVIAVIRSWFYYMRGQPVYVPDYGFATIEDVGAGFADKDWIDLGYSESQWSDDLFSYNTTLYFLTPAPESILYILP